MSQKSERVYITNHHVDDTGAFISAGFKAHLGRAILTMQIDLAPRQPGEADQPADVRDALHQLIAILQEVEKSPSLLTWSDPDNI